MARIQNAVKGMGFGAIMLLVGIVVLCCNEGRNVKEIKGNNQAEKVAIQVASSPISSDNEGSLVCTNGKLVVADAALKDATFGVSAKTAKLVRKVEVYQWTEKVTKDKEDNNVYSYEKTWSSSLIDSSKFNDKSGTYANPVTMPFEAKTSYATDVSVGDFKLTEEQVGKLSTNATVQPIALAGYSADGKYLTNASSVATAKVGDYRINFVYNNSNAVTLMGQQVGNTIQTWVASKGGKNFNIVQDGAKTKEVLIQQEKSGNKFLAWLLRILGLALMISGIGAVLKPITATTSYVPVLGTITGIGIKIVAFLIGGALGILIIAIAWITVRPVLGIILLLVVAGLITLFIMMKKKNGGATPPASTPTTPEVK